MVIGRWRAELHEAQDGFGDRNGGGRRECVELLGPDQDPSRAFPNRALALALDQTEIRIKSKIKSKIKRTRAVTAPGLRRFGDFPAVI